MTYTTPVPGSYGGPASFPHLGIEVPRLQALAESDRELCFAIEGSPPGSGRSVLMSDGSLRLVHELEGFVVCVTQTHLDLGSAVGLVRVRLVLPRAIRLDGLLGHRVSLETTHRLGAHGAFDLRLRDPRGTLVLWAYDGVVPGGDDALGVLWDGASVVLRSGASADSAPRRLGEVHVEGRGCRCVTLRASAENAAFVVLG